MVTLHLIGLWSVYKVGIEAGELQMLCSEVVGVIRLRVMACNMWILSWSSSNYQLIIDVIEASNGAIMSGLELSKSCMIQAKKLLECKVFPCKTCIHVVVLHIPGCHCDSQR